MGKISRKCLNFRAKNYFLLYSYRIVIEADSDSAVGGITPIDGPVGDSLIGSVDNVFKAIKDYDQFRCIERMICEAMAEQSDIPGLDGIVSTLTGETPAQQTLASTFGGSGGSRPPSSGSILDSLENLILGGGGFRRRESRPPRPIRRPPPPRPFRGQSRPRPQPPLRRRPPPQRRVDNLLGEDDFKPSRRIRAKRQTRLQGNLIR